MKHTGSVFVEEGSTVYDSLDASYQVAICFDGNGGLFVHMNYEQARELHSQIGAALHTLESAEECVQCMGEGMMPYLIGGEPEPCPHCDGQGTKRSHHDRTSTALT
jgi:hypothetical protein